MSQTVFVAGGSGFIGLEFCRACVAAGYTVLALCRSEAAVRRVEALGARAVKGDLLQPGAWQGVARRAGQVVQLAQPPLVFGRMSAQQAWKYNRERKAMDVNLLGALDSRGVARVLYVSGACYYGNLGPDLHDEAATPRPRGVGRLAAGGVLRVSHYLEAGLPIVTAFPG
jgi:nucleoside-diphosphate-sugar epimerase